MLHRDIFVTRGSLRKSGDLLKLGVLQHKVLEIIGLGHELGG